MNIKEHIEAGHYPTDERGRALVPMQNGRTATIYATDVPDTDPIIGWDGVSLVSWRESGKFSETAIGLCLLPPQPRKVKKQTWGLFWPEDDEDYPGVCYGMNKTEAEARARSVIQRSGLRTVHLRVVLLTGEYEEPWA